MAGKRKPASSSDDEIDETPSTNTRRKKSSTEKHDDDDGTLKIPTTITTIPFKTFDRFVEILKTNSTLANNSYYSEGFDNTSVCIWYNKMVTDSKKEKKFEFPTSGGKLRVAKGIPKKSRSYPNHSYINHLFNDFIKANLTEITADMENELNQVATTREKAQKAIDKTYTGTQNKTPPIEQFNDDTDYSSDEDEDEVVDLVKAVAHDYQEELFKEFENKKKDIKEQYKKRKTEAVSPIFAAKLNNIKEKVKEVKLAKPPQLEKISTPIQLEPEVELIQLTDDSMLHSDKGITSNEEEKNNDLKIFSKLEIKFVNCIESDKSANDVYLTSTNKVVDEMKKIQKKYFTFLETERVLNEEKVRQLELFEIQKQNYLKKWQEKYEKVIGDRQVAEQDEKLKSLNDNISMYETIIRGTKSEMTANLEAEEKEARNKAKAMFEKFKK